MGASQSKSEPVIFYNPNVPLQFSQSLVDSFEKKAEQTPEKLESRQIEALVNQRVAEELQKVKSTESEMGEKLYLVDQQTENNALESQQDIETMIGRIKRSSAKELPKEVQERQDAVIACYNNNPNRSLDCWKDVANFKAAVLEEQKKFVSAHQN
ncbi:hypothetical protein K501DRAFT_217363 [Backusella circina FSU 941]|nr:hypothetical protein K501DRAFT_217363 [Backusella circina FSU 941]